MKKVMTKAWEIAKKAAAKFGGRAIEYIALALREAWREIKTMISDITERIEELEKMGFKRWQKNGMDRMYINASVLGLTCVYHKTGTVAQAWFNGTDISNSEANRMKGSKTYIDLIKKCLVSDNDYLADAAANLIGADHKFGDKYIKL